jgi:hypothetical protein
MDRWGVSSYAGTRFIVNKSLEPLGNKVRKDLKKAWSQWEIIRWPSRGEMHGTHLAQEDHYSQLAVIYCWRLAACYQSLRGIMNDPG